MPDMELYLGDCVQVMRERIKDESIDLTVTSPPYDNLRTYNGYVFDFEATARELWRVTKPGGVVVWVVNQSYDKGGETGTVERQKLFFMSIGFLCYQTLIWEKQSPSIPTHQRYYDVFEYMFVFSKDRPNTLNLIADRKNVCVGIVKLKDGEISADRRYQLSGKRHVPGTSRRWNIWRIPATINESEHPAVFPEALARDHILSWSNPGDLVLDPFMGSGTTGKMAKLLHRNFIGIDISEEYCNIAAKRIAETQAPAITEEGVFVQPEQAPLFEVA